MITTAFLNIAYLFIDKIVSFFPFSQGFPSAMMSGFNILTSFAIGYNWLFPFSHLYVILSLVLSVVILEFAWRTIKSLFSHIPWIGGK